ncbi:hypothetical protein BDY24DRAFT_405429 [Mrakia frigida]|uniref:uncharacterized protein n=1 Tax=Mrakia frigida TaxID=29902 RepID=UPI003FCC1006
MYSFTRVVDGEERDKVELKLRAFEDKTVNKWLKHKLDGNWILVGLNNEHPDAMMPSDLFVVAPDNNNPAEGSHRLITRLATHLPIRIAVGQRDQFDRVQIAAQMNRLETGIGRAPSTCPSVVAKNRHIRRQAEIFRSNNFHDKISVNKTTELLKTIANSRASLLKAVTSREEGRRLTTKEKSGLEKVLFSLGVGTDETDMEIRKGSGVHKDEGKRVVEEAKTLLSVLKDELEKARETSQRTSKRRVAPPSSVARPTSIVPLPGSLRQPIPPSHPFPSNPQQNNHHLHPPAPRPPPQNTTSLPPSQPRLPYGTASHFPPPSQHPHLTFPQLHHQPTHLQQSLSISSSTINAPNPTSANIDYSRSHSGFSTPQQLQIVSSQPSHSSYGYPSSSLQQPSSVASSSLLPLSQPLALSHNAYLPLQHQPSIETRSQSHSHPLAYEPSPGRQQQHQTTVLSSFQTQGHQQRLPLSSTHPLLHLPSNITFTSPGYGLSYREDHGRASFGQSMGGRNDSLQANGSYEVLPREQGNFPQVDLWAKDKARRGGLEEFSMV